MKILVTGGAGFIGSHLNDKLLKAGSEIIIYDNFDNYYNPNLKRANIKNLIKQKKCTLIEGDICNFRKVENLFKKEKPDIVIHLAARPGVLPSIKKPKLYEKVNIRGTLNLLEDAKKFKIQKFIFASSSSVYGNANMPFKEDLTLCKPISPYGSTKLAAEHFCHNFSSLYGIPTVVLRFFTVYGPRQRPDLAIIKFIKKIDRDEPIEIYGSIKRSRDFTYIDDIVQGIVNTIKLKTQFEIINLGNSKPVKLLDLIKIIEKGLDKKAKTRIIPAKAGDVENTFADIQKAKKLLGFEPKTSFEKGIEETIDWYRISN